MSDRLSVGTRCIVLSDKYRSSNVGAEVIVMQLVNPGDIITIGKMGGYISAANSIGTRYVVEGHICGTGFNMGGVPIPIQGYSVYERHRLMPIDGHEPTEDDMDVVLGYKKEATV